MHCGRRPAAETCSQGVTVAGEPDVRCPGALPAALQAAGLHGPGEYRGEDAARCWSRLVAALAQAIPSRRRLTPPSSFWRSGLAVKEWPGAARVVRSTLAAGGCRRLPGHRPAIGAVLRS